MRYLCPAIHFSQARSAFRQRGAALLVSLIMLVVLTLFAISAINITNVNLKIVGNMQARKAANAAAQNAIETVLGNIAYFNNPTSAVSITDPLGMTVTVDNRRCLHTLPAPGYSAISPISPEDTFWDVKVAVSDPITGAQTTVHQGVKVRLLAGYCTYP